MKRRFTAEFTALLLVFAMLLSACGQAPASQQEAAPDTQKLSADDTAENEKSIASPADAEAPETPSLQGPPDGYVPDPSARSDSPDLDELKTRLSVAQAEVGAVVDEIDEAEAEEIERGIRDYTGPTTSHSYEEYPHNNAVSYYYYERLDRDTRAIYDALLDAAYNLYEPEYHVKATLSFPPDDSRFDSSLNLAQYALIYDHPELFWLKCGHNTETYAYYTNGQTGPYYDYYFLIDNIDQSVSQEMIYFNKYAEAYMDLIYELAPSNADDLDMAVLVHDVIIYNTVYDQEAASSPAGAYSLSHTAYGPIAQVRGEFMYAVCDGYSQAYQYLLQQLGIDSVVVLGEVMPGGGHAWSIVNLDGIWTEVDVTWDDNDNGPSYDFFGLSTTDMNSAHNISVRDTNPRYISTALMEMAPVA